MTWLIFSHEEDVGFFQMLSNDELNHHVVLTNNSVKLDNSVSNLTLTTLAGDNLVIKYDTQADMVRL